jgi:sterol desaturase/sphingolipid hydroxylase (fatty acid hydroxylase superfamily)
MSPALWILAGVVALLVVEVAQGRHKGVHRIQDVYIVAASLAQSVLLKPVLAVLTAWVMGLLMPQWKGELSWVPFWAAFPAVLLMAEFCQYWVHRWAHDSRGHPLLYGMHRTHHTAPYVNVTLLYRSNVWWAFIHPYLWVSAAAIYLGQPAAAGVFYLGVMLFNVITHSDWRWDDTIIAKVPGGRWIVGAWELALVSPRIHHTHHGYGRDGKAFRNFNTILTIYDRMFGTLHVPQGRPWRYGVPGGEHHWVAQMLFPLMPLGEAKRRDRLNRVVAD